MDNRVTFDLTMGSDDYEMVKSKLPSKMFEKIETQREVKIMKEVLRHKGSDFIEKVDNTITEWENRPDREAYSCHSEENYKYKIKGTIYQFT